LLQIATGSGNFSICQYRHCVPYTLGNFVVFLRLKG
jgi:hypothetical protein